MRGIIRLKTIRLSARSDSLSKNLPKLQQFYAFSDTILAWF